MMRSRPRPAPTMALLVVTWFMAFNLQASAVGKRMPPGGWDADGCRKAAAHGADAACRNCKDAARGFGASFETNMKSVMGESSGASAWLRIAVGTVPRMSDVPYLTRVVQAISRQLPEHVQTPPKGPPFQTIETLVVNFRPGQHQVFESTKAIFAPPHPQAPLFRFVETNPVRCDPPVPQNWDYHAELSPEVGPRQQTRDVITLLRMAAGLASKSSKPTCSYVMLVEDDFELCPAGMQAIKMAIAAASRTAWTGLRVGIAGNGIVIPCADVLAFTEYLVNNEYMMPVDLLSAEWFARMIDESKRYFSDTHKFRINQYNLFNHLGHVSTFTDGRGARKTPSCGDGIFSKSWIKAENFNKGCTRYGMSPCDTSVARDGAAHYRYVLSGAPKTSLPGTIFSVVAELGQSCEAACAAHSEVEKEKNFACDDGAFEHLANCRVLRRHFGGCTSGCLTATTLHRVEGFHGLARSALKKIASMFGSGNDEAHTSMSDKVDLNGVPGAVIFDSKSDASGMDALCSYEVGARASKPRCSHSSQHMSRLCPCLQQGAHAAFDSANRRAAAARPRN